MYLQIHRCILVEIVKINYFSIQLIFMSLFYLQPYTVLGPKKFISAASYYPHIQIKEPHL